MTHPDPTRFGPSSQLNDSVARVLRAASLVLALLFVMRVLLGLGSLSSGPMAVLLRLSESMVSQAPIAILVVCLIGVSVLVDAECRSTRRLALSLRSAALPMAFAYLLMIPLYGSAQWWRSRIEARALQESVQTSLLQLRATRTNVQQASSAEQLNQLWASLPAGAPPLTRFGSTPRQQRTALLRFLDRVSRLLQARLEGVEKQLLIAVVRNTLLYSLACLGLAALFYRSSQLSLPSRRGEPMAAGRSPSGRGRRRGGPLDHELELMVEHSIDPDIGAVEPRGADSIRDQPA